MMLRPILLIVAVLSLYAACSAAYITPDPVLPPVIITPVCAPRWSSDCLEWSA